MNIVCHESFCKPWYFRDSAWRLLQKRPGGGISKRAKKASEKDGTSLQAFIYSCVCLFLSDFYDIFQKWSHWGLKFKGSIKKKQVRLISGSDPLSGLFFFLSSLLAFGFYLHFSHSGLTPFNRLEPRNGPVYLKGSSPPGLTSCSNPQMCVCASILPFLCLHLRQFGEKNKATAHADVWG